MRVLVTGGAGFIGSSLVHALLLRGDCVRVLDDLSTGHRENLAGLGNQVELVVGDLLNGAVVRAAMTGVDAVLHQAALPGVRRSLEDPVATHRTNVEGTLNVLVAARDEGVRRVVCASSSRVYGDGGPLPHRETETTAPASPYGAAALASEHYAKVFFHCFGVETVALRYFNVFGPRQEAASAHAAVVPRFVHAVLRGEPVVLYGDGRQTRDFTFVANVVDANLRALAAPGVGGRVFNVAAGIRVSVLELLETIGRLLGREVRADHQPVRSGEVRDSQAAIDAARDSLGYLPSIPFEEGLRRSIEWYESVFASQ